MKTWATACGYEGVAADRGVCWRLSSSRSFMISIGAPMRPSISTIRPLRLFEQRQKDVLDVHLRMAVALHHFVGTPGSLLGLLGELVKTHHYGCASLV